MKYEHKKKKSFYILL